MQKNEPKSNVKIDNARDPSDSSKDRPSDSDSSDHSRPTGAPRPPTPKGADAKAEVTEP
jgi:hypothetical protein